MERKLMMMDDDFQHVLSLKSVLPLGINIVHAYDFRDASRLVAQHQLSIAVLKLCADTSTACFEFLSDLRAARPMPILMTHTVTKEERTRAYDMGADLCIDAPADIIELAAGIRAMLRRYYTLNRMAQRREADMALRYKSLVIDPQRRSVSMCGQPVYLSAKEFEVLYFLAQNPGIVFAQETIYERVWKTDFPFGSRCVTDHISSIRQKLGQQPGDESYIETIYGVGYRFASSP